jgi:hypothetical protein
MKAEGGRRLWRWEEGVWGALWKEVGGGGRKEVGALGGRKLGWGYFKVVFWL